MVEKSAGAEGVLAALGERFRDAATVEVVFGNPIAAAGKTVVPVARVAFGFGGGASPASRRRSQGEGGGTEDEAAGGGGGVFATPVGVVEIDQQGTRFVRFAQELHLGIAFGAGLFLGLVLARLRRHGHED
jgi:uncharacterized spore protein YtfJ